MDSPSTTLVPHFLRNVMTGFFGQALSKLATAPFQRCRIILDTQKSMYGKKEYQGLLDVMMRLIKEQGFLSLWRGNLWHILRYIPSQMVIILLRDPIYNLFATFDKKTHYFSYLMIKITSGAILSGSALAIVYPIDVSIL